jgi:endonuclease YncB( thermonuclease family)
MKRASLAILILAFPYLVSQPIHAGQFKVVRVTDGDTIKIRAPGSKSDFNIRLIGIDAPETSKKKIKPGQPFSQKSTKYLAGLVLNKPVEIQSYGTDRYGRTLGVVYLNGANVNLEMVKVGLGEVYRGKLAKGFDNKPYWEAEKEAREAGRGMWSLGDRYVSPREWRRKRK